MPSGPASKTNTKRAGLADACGEAAAVRAGLEPRAPAAVGGMARAARSSAELCDDVGAARSASRLSSAPGVRLRRRASRPQAASANASGDSAALCAHHYSTVTLFARLRGWSTSVPLSVAMW